MTEISLLHIQSAIWWRGRNEDDKGDDYEVKGLAEFSNTYGMKNANIMCRFWNILFARVEHGKQQTLMLLEN